MTAHACRPEGTPWISPYVIVSNVDKAADFYVDAFGFEKIHLVAGEDGTSWHAEMRYQDHLIMFGKSGAYGGKTKSPNESQMESPINLYLYCENVDQFYQHALKSGAKSLSEPEDTFWNDRMCRVQDPDGYVWCFATYLGDE